MKAPHQQGRMVHVFCRMVRVFCTPPPPETPLSCQHLAEKQEDQKLKVNSVYGEFLASLGHGSLKKKKKSAEDYSKTQLTT